jgi:hypothetical protein
VKLTDKFTADELGAFSAAQIRYLSQREDLLRAALEDCLIAGPRLRDALLNGHPIWFDSMQPLYPSERTMLLVEACKMLEIPVPAWLRKAAEDSDRAARAQQAEVERQEKMAGRA